MRQKHSYWVFNRLSACALAALFASGSPAVLAETLVVASILPNSRSVEVGSPATLFASMLNAGSMEATGCTVSLPPELATFGSTFSFQTTNPASNSPVGAPNQPVNIPPGGLQTFVLALEPSEVIAAQEIAPLFQCANAPAAGTILGVNTFTFAASTIAVPDVVALSATLTSDGIVELPSATGSNAFTVATINLGAGGNISATAELSTPGIPATVTACETEPATALCINPLIPTSDPIDSTIAGQATPTFSFFVTGSGDVPFDPATNRVFVRFTDQDGETRGATSVALRTGLPVPRLDESFAIGGSLAFDASIANNAEPIIQETNDSIILASGQILLAGSQSGLTRSEFKMLRLNVDGSIDTSFGSQGLATSRLSDLPVPGLFFVGDIRVAELADGRLLFMAEANGDLLLLRYTADGVLDTSFANQGTRLLDLSGRDDRLRDAVLTSDGEIVIVGEIENPASARASDPFVLRLTENGSLDPTFGTDGVSIVNSPGPDILSNSFDAVTLTTDGRIVAVGTVRNSASSAIGDDLLVARFLEDGTPDSTFGSAGLVILDTGSNLEVLLAVDTNAAGEVFATGEHDNDLILLKLEENGALDSDFGTQGFVFVDVPDDQGNVQSNSGDAIFVQPNNTILVPGSFAGIDTGRLLVMMSFSTNGALAVNFAETGIFPFDSFVQDNVRQSVGAVVQDQQGRLVVATEERSADISDSNLRVSRFFVR